MDFAGEVLRDRERARPAGGVKGANVGKLVQRGIAEDKIGRGGCGGHCGQGV